VREEVILAKKAIAMMLLVEPRVGESLRDYVARAEREVAGRARQREPVGV